MTLIHAQNQQCVTYVAPMKQIAARSRILLAALSQLCRDCVYVAAEYACMESTGTAQFAHFKTHIVPAEVSVDLIRSACPSAHKM